MREVKVLDHVDVVPGVEAWDDGALELCEVK